MSIWLLPLRAGMLAAYITIGVASGCSPASAEDWPSRPVKVIVPYGPGGIADTLARLTADRLAKSLGQPFIVENKGGAGGIIGTEFAARSPNDGYTLYFAGGAQFTVKPADQQALL
jgi:tripartite-type tricarboxylate transporter receptor subunit TctC